MEQDLIEWYNQGKIISKTYLILTVSHDRNEDIVVNLLEIT